jgi:hypothetical protein
MPFWLSGKKGSRGILPREEGLVLFVRQPCRGELKPVPAPPGGALTSRENGMRGALLMGRRVPQSGLPPKRPRPVGAGPLLLQGRGRGPSPSRRGRGQRTWDLLHLLRGQEARVCPPKQGSVFPFPMMSQAWAPPQGQVGHPLPLQNLPQRVHPLEVVPRKSFTPAFKVIDFPAARVSCAVEARWTPGKESWRITLAAEPPSPPSAFRFVPCCPRSGLMLSGQGATPEAE